MHSEEKVHVRLDKWLWAARFFKTRSLAAAAVSGGKVQVNGARVKPARSLHLGDELLIRRGAFEWQVIVRALEKQRGAARVASLLYEETEESRRRRDLLAAERGSMGMHQRDFGARPSKKDRRAILRFTRNHS